MNELQKVIKYCAMGFAAFLAFSIITGMITAVIALTSVLSGAGSSKTVDVSRSFEDVKSITAENSIGTLEIKIGNSDKIEVEATNVSEDFIIEKSFSGNLKIKGKFNLWGVLDRDNGKKGTTKITIYVPKNFVAENVKIQAGAGNINIEALSTKMLDIDAGTGNIYGKNIIASEVKLNGGVGEITLTEVDISNVDIDSGVGNINLEGILRGKNKIDCGVGEVDLTLYASVDDYNLKIEKGLGNVRIDGEKYSDLEWNNITASNSLDIDGGLGNIDIVFE